MWQWPSPTIRLLLQVGEINRISIYLPIYSSGKPWIELNKVKKSMNTGKNSFVLQPRDLGLAGPRTTYCTFHLLRAGFFFSLHATGCEGWGLLLKLHRIMYKSATQPFLASSRNAPRIMYSSFQTSGHNLIDTVTSYDGIITLCCWIYCQNLNFPMLK